MTTQKSNTKNASKAAQTKKLGKSPHRNMFLWALIASLSVSALLAIFVFIAGQFGETEIRLLLTTLAIGAYSLTGLCSSALYDKQKYQLVGAIGIIVSVIGSLFALGNIWSVIDLPETWKVLLILIVVPVSIAHASLLLMIDSTTRLVGAALRLTLSFIAAVALLLIYAITRDFDLEGQIFYRLLGVFAVLDVLGTIATPLLRKVSN